MNWFGENRKGYYRKRAEFGRRRGIITWSLLVGGHKTGKTRGIPVGTLIRDEGAPRRLRKFGLSTLKLPEQCENGGKRNNSKSIGNSRIRG